jgi:hypothetical protein
MTERPKGTSPYIAKIAGGEPPFKADRGIEYEHLVGPEVGLQERQISSLSPRELLELKQYLGVKGIDVRQAKLQQGQVTAGYAKSGAIQMADGKIAFRPNQNNEIITGAPQEFLDALKTVDETL